MHLDLSKKRKRGFRGKGRTNDKIGSFGCFDDGFASTSAVWELNRVLRLSYWIGRVLGQSALGSCIGESQNFRSPPESSLPNTSYAPPTPIGRHTRFRLGDVNDVLLVGCSTLRASIRNRESIASII